MSDHRLLVALEQCSVQLGDHLALRDVTFKLHAGERWVLVGANGSGKSVLLKLLRGDMWPTPTGRERRQYCFSGLCNAEPGDDKQHMVYLAPERQDKYLRYDWNLTVTQVVATGLFDEDIPLTKVTARQQAHIQKMLRRLRLWSLRDRSLLTLSYGQRRRVLLARGLIAQPQVLLLDEVFNGVDARTRTQLRDLLEKPRQYPTWVLAAHSAEDIPATATHMLRLQQGRVMYSGPMDASQLVTVQRDVQARHKAARKRIATQLPVTGNAAALRSNRKSKTPVAAQQRSVVISLRNVALYRDYRPVLRDVNWTVVQGEHWAIMGENGSGKSSLLMLLYGDLHPAHGGVIERDGMQPGMPIKHWKHRVGYVSPELQARHFAAGSIAEIVASGRHASVGLNLPITRSDKAAAQPWLKFFGIEHLRERQPRQVSYGQLRLALLARAMINHPQLLLLDEPFTGLDPELHAHAMAALQRLAESGTQVIMAVHDTADILPAVRNVLSIERGGSVQLSERFLKPG
jgi:molybdate transport system ATP-binding protein